VKPIYSMTGFASMRGSVEEGLEFTLTAKSVNHRFLDLQFRLPGGLDGLEAKLRQMLKARMGRGHVDLTLTLDRSGECELWVNDKLLSSALRSFRAAATRHGLGSEPDLNLLLRLPGVVCLQRATSPDASSGWEEIAVKLAGELIEALLSARAEEGATLAAELRSAMERLRGMSAEVGELRGRVRDSQFDRLHLRLGELLQGAELSEDRVLAEAAMMAERSDVEEENVRLLTHVERFLAMLDAGGEVGKRLDFLLQELNREANTMLSKTSGAAGEGGLRITEIGLEMKAQIERAREQVQNLE